MPTLELKPTHKPVQNYYAALREFEELGVRHETGIRSAFQNLLDHCAHQHDWHLVPEWEIRRPRQHPLRVDGALLDNFRLTHGFWEAKDIHDDLRREARRKFDAGYPRDNIVFQTPHRALLYQNDALALDADLTKPPALIETLKLLVSLHPQSGWPQEASQREALAMQRSRIWQKKAKPQRPQRPRRKNILQFILRGVCGLRG